jgi:hypothetical protein
MEGVLHLLAEMSQEGGHSQAGNGGVNRRRWSGLSAAFGLVDQREHGAGKAVAGGRGSVAS